VSHLNSVIEISCLEVWREISNYIDDEVEPELRSRMEAHFKVCAHCTAVLEGTRNVVKLIADGVGYDIPPGFGKRLYRKIMAR
jgi:anti-sigma factor RsiW